MQKPHILRVFRIRYAVLLYNNSSVLFVTTYEKPLQIVCPYLVVAGDSVGDGDLHVEYDVPCKAISM